MLISVIVPTCNRPHDLEKCLALLDPEKQGLEEDNYEVIVTDDSVEPAADVLRTKFPNVKWLAGPRRGPAANRNQGAQNASGDWLVFTDDDCHMASDCLRAYAQNVGEHLEGSVFEGRTLASGKQERVDEEAPVNEAGGYLWSCNFCVKSEIFAKLGGFDEGFPSPAMEDIDFRVRLLAAGFKLIFVKEAMVEHPWRRMRGLRFAISHGKSLAYYLNRYPNQRTRFWKALPLTVPRICKQRIRLAVKLKSSRGLFRAVGLDLVNVFCGALFSYFSLKSTPHSETGTKPIDV